MTSQEKDPCDNEGLIGSPKKKVDLDVILVEEIGQIGPYQLRNLGLSAVLVIFAAWAAGDYVFTTARINTRCLIPECETIETNTFHPSWIYNTIPASGGSFDNCRRFDTTNSSATSSGECPATWFNQNRTRACEEYLYENTNTVVFDYGLACEEWLRTLIGSVRTAGTLAALPITGYASDRWGRRTALSLCAVHTAWLGVVRYFAGSYLTFILSEFLQATFGSGGFSCAYILLMELIGPKYRVAAGAVMNTFFSLGHITMGLIAWRVPNWKNLTLALYVPQLITISYFWIVSESVRWYMINGRYDEAEKVLKKVARVNKKELSQRSLHNLRDSAKKEKDEKDLLDQKTEESLIRLVFRHKAILKRLIVSPIWWITMTFVYYGMSINSVNMSGHNHLNYIAVAMADIPGFWIAVVLMSKIGRKPVLIGAYWVCAACQIGYIFMPEGMYSMPLMLYLIGKCSIAMVMTTVYVYTAELFPTKYRHTLFAFSSMMGRIGSIIAPLSPAFSETWKHLPFALFACFALLSGLLVLLTPETLGCKLPDTMEEASDIGVKKTRP